MKVLSIIQESTVLVLLLNWDMSKWVIEPPCLLFTAAMRKVSLETWASCWGPVPMVHWLWGRRTVSSCFPWPLSDMAEHALGDGTHQVTTCPCGQSEVVLTESDGCVDGWFTLALSHTFMSKALLFDVCESCWCSGYENDTWHNVDQIAT